MTKIEKIKDLSNLEPHNLCYISETVLKINGIELNNDYNDIKLWFTENPFSIKGCSVYSYTSNPPNIDREFYILHIKDFITCELNGIESIRYQRDNWLTHHDIFGNGSYITTSAINNGVACWMYNSETKSVINSTDTIYDVLNQFDGYDIEIYKVYKI